VQEKGHQPFLVRGDEGSEEGEVDKSNRRKYVPGLNRHSNGNLIRPSPPYDDRMIILRKQPLSHISQVLGGI
jgi:hypothetical protein